MKRQRWMQRKARRKNRGVVPDDEALLDQYRGVQFCWWCGRSKFCQPHHLVSRGMGGWSRADVSLNLAALCIDCHQATHSHQRPLYCDLVAVVAARNGVSQAEIEDALRNIRWGRLP